VLEDIDFYTEDDLREALEEGESFDRAWWLSDKSQKNFVRPLGPDELTAFCILAKRTAAPGLPRPVSTARSTSGMLSQPASSWMELL
jgi:hypothetical protein